MSEAVEALGSGGGPTPPRVIPQLINWGVGE